MDLVRIRDANENEVYEHDMTMKSCWQSFGTMFYYSSVALG
jgi:hypothetical protein